MVKLQFFLFLVVLPRDFSKGERDLRISQSEKNKKVKENEKVCAQDEGKTPKFQSSLILLHFVWESCTNKKRMKERRIKAQLCLSEYFQYVLNEKPPVFHDGSLKGEGNRSSCHLLGMYSPISLRVFKTLGPACVWGNPTATMYKVVKNIILRSPWELKKYKLIFDSCSRREICKLLVRGCSFATPQGRGELLKLMGSLDLWYKEQHFRMLFS